MSFNIVLGCNTSERNAFEKTITKTITLSGNLKTGTSIIDPVILIETTSAIAGLNYMKIETFKRSYFITNIKSVRNGLWEVSAHVDVLASFKDEILANRAIIRRQENKSNLLLNDGFFKVEQETETDLLAFPQGFNDAERSYVLITSANSRGSYVT